MAKFIKLFCLTGLGVMLLCLFSCEQKQEPVKAVKQVRVVSKSIDQAKRVRPKAPDPVVTPPQKQPENSNMVKSEPLAESKLKSKENPSEAPAATAVSVGKKAESVERTTVLKEQEKLKPVVAGQSSLPALSDEKYDTKGRIDPFIPLLREKKANAVVAKVKPKVQRPKRILTPLEKMDIGQFKLVAVIEMKKGTIAMVEEASGKGYEVGVGTYIGRHEGRITDITRDRIVVKEYVTDFKGDRRERIQEIKFHKDEGGK